MTLSWPRAALLSLSDKRGAVEFARALARATARASSPRAARRGTSQAGASTVTPVEELDRLRRAARRPGEDAAPARARADPRAPRRAPRTWRRSPSAASSPIDLVAVTLYPFEQRAARARRGGGDRGDRHRRRRAAARRGEELRRRDRGPRSRRSTPRCCAALRARRAHARAAPRAGRSRTFARTARYDAAIAARAGARARRATDAAAACTSLALERVRGAALRREPAPGGGALRARPASAAALEAWRRGRSSRTTTCSTSRRRSRWWARFEAPACVIVKHNQPCGAACAATLAEALRGGAARRDELSAFGGIVAFNRPLDAGDRARAGARSSSSAWRRRSSRPRPSAALASKKNLRAAAAWRAATLRRRTRWRAARSVGPLGAAAARAPASRRPTWRSVTRRAPTAGRARGAALRLGGGRPRRARTRSRSRAARSSIGLGSGQTSRVDAVDVALMKARRAGHDARGRGAGERRVLPVRRQHRARGRGRHHRDRPARRLDARRRGDRGLRPPRRGDDVHRPPGVPALSRAADDRADLARARTIARDGDRRRTTRARDAAMPRRTRARPDPRLRLAVHAAHRAPRARAGRLLRDRAAATRRSPRSRAQASERADPVGLAGERLPRRGAAARSRDLRRSGKPLLGICYGFQATDAAAWAARVAKARARRVRHRDVRARRPLAAVRRRAEALPRLDEPRRRGAGAARRTGCASRTPRTARSPRRATRRCRST